MHTSDFEFEKRLASGAFGTIFLVRNKANNLHYVIKTQSNAMYKNVVKEANLLKKMHHPNIITYYDFWYEGRQNYILMEYATSGTLRRFLNRSPDPLEPDDALYLFSQIVLGVNHIHNYSIIHRDLKPENIMMTGCDGNVIKIGDFGVARYVRNDLARTFAGTKIYIAPEILDGCPYDSMCDIWSIGIIFYEMITKEFPFVIQDTSSMIEDIILGDIIHIPRGETTRRCNSLYRRMLNLNPDNRPDTTELLYGPLFTYVKRVHRNLRRTERDMMSNFSTFEDLIG